MGNDSKFYPCSSELVHRELYLFGQLKEWIGARILNTMRLDVCDIYHKVFCKLVCCYISEVLSN
jgi:hypothetical protein